MQDTRWNARQGSKTEYRVKYKFLKVARTRLIYRETRFLAKYVLLWFIVETHLPR